MIVKSGVELGMIIIYNFVLDLSNIMPTWGDSTLSGIYVTLLYFSGFLILSMVLYFILRAVFKKNQTFVPMFSLSLSFTITGFLAFLVSAVFFILYWVWHRGSIVHFLPVLPVFLISLFFLHSSYSFFFHMVSFRTT